MVGIVETHVQQVNKDRIRHKICHSWQFVDNYSQDPFGRIRVGWNAEIMSVSVLHMSAQAIFLDVTTFQHKIFVVTFVYESNDIIQRRLLWAELKAFDAINSKPWMVLGDFSSILEVTDKVGGVEVTPSYYYYFWECTQDVHLFDLRYSGCLYTWSNKHEDDTRLASKIDRGDGEFGVA